MSLKELNEKRNTLAGQMRNLHETIGDNEWTVDQRTQWDNMKKELDNLDGKIERENELRQFDQQFVENQTPPQEQRQVDPQLEPRSVFDEFMRRGAQDFSAEQRKVLAEMRVQSVGSNEQGGYTVPKEFQARIVAQMQAYGGLANISRILTTSDGRTIEWLTADSTSEVGELVGENQAATEADTAFGIANLGAKKLSSKVIRVSNELLQDSAIDIEGYLADRIAERIGRAEAKFLVQGTGAGSPQQPKGLEVSVTGTTTATTVGKVDWKDINALIHAIDPAYRGAGNTRLLFNDNTFRVLKELEDAQKRPLWLPSIAGVAPSTILGYQYAIDQGVADIGTGKKFLYFGDFNRFIVRRVSYMTLKRLVERYAEFDQVGFLAFHRFDCALEDASAIKALVGK